jgi:predicted nucleic acid-binding protein
VHIANKAELTHLKKKGTPIGANDLLIAAHALALDAVLVTDNVREFECIPSLKNWISQIPPFRKTRKNVN